jgi:hypothetical protein
MDSLGAARARAVVLGAPRFADPGAAVADGRASPLPARRFVAVHSLADREAHASLGMHAYMALAEPRGVELATDLLSELGVERPAIAAWLADQADRRGLMESLEGNEPEAEVA